MKLKQKFKKIIIICTGIVLLAAGCGGGPAPAGQSKQIVLNFWDPFETSENFLPLITAYQQLHPTVRIVYTKKDIATYQSDVLDALASGNGPDIFSINNAWLPQYLDKVVAATGTAWTYKNYKQNFVDVAVNDFTVDQKIYGVPLAVDSLALYYNKDILGTAGIATPPKTWLELAQDTQKIKRQDRTGYFTQSGVAMGTNSNVNRAVDILYLLMLQKGAVPFSQDHLRPSFANSVQVNGNASNPGFDALAYYTSFSNPSSLNYNWNQRSDYSVDAFANGRAAFLYSYSYMAATIRQKNPNLNFDVAPVPQPSLDQNSVNFANYWGEVVSRQSKYSYVAWDFLNFLSSKDSLDKYYAKHKQPSSRLDLIALQTNDADIGVFASANLTAKSFYRPDQEKMDNIFGQMIDNVVLSGKSLTDALNLAQQQAATLTKP